MKKSWEQQRIQCLPLFREFFLFSLRQVISKESLIIKFPNSAFLICDRIGRIWATRILCVIWALGIAIFMIGGVKGNLGAIYAGRFIAGLGVGQTPVVG